MHPLETTLNVDFEEHHLRKSQGPGLLSNGYPPSHVYDRTFFFSLLVVFSNCTTVSLFRWQLHSKRRSSHPSAGIRRSSGFKAQSKVCPGMLFLWDHADKPNGSPSNVPARNKTIRHPGSTEQMPIEQPKSCGVYQGSAVFLPLGWSSSRFTLDSLQIKWQHNNLCASPRFGFKPYN